MAKRERGSPTISVVIPTHNRRPLLRQVLAGLSQQTYPAWKFEVIVIVDASTDRTREMLDALSTPYDLRVIEREQSGPAATRNAGLTAARGQAVIFLDDDVIPSPDLVGAHAEVHALDERAVVLGRVTACCGVSRPGWERWEDYIAERDYRLIERKEARPSGGLFYTWNVSASRECLDEVGGFDPTLAFQEDIDVGYRLQDVGARFYFRSEAAGQHCGHRPTYAAWSRRHYRFGYYRMVMQQRGKTRLLHSLRDSIESYNPLTRLYLQLTIGRDGRGTVAELTCRVSAAFLDAVHGWPLSRILYSLLAIHHYWRGVKDAHGDVPVLRDQLFRAREAAPVVSARAQ